MLFKLRPNPICIKFTLFNSKVKIDIFYIVPVHDKYFDVIPM